MKSTKGCRRDKSASLSKYSTLSRRTFSKLFGSLFVKLSAEDRFATVSGNAANELSTNLHTSSGDDAITNVQGHGVLLIKTYKWRNQLSWDKRFFMLKDSFLLIYATSERKLFEVTHQINTRPKGAIPISGCYVTACRQHDFEFCIAISHEDFQRPVFLATPDDRSQSSWIQRLQQASKVTFHNVQLTEMMVQTLESQSMRLHEEKQLYWKKLQHELDTLLEVTDKNQKLRQLKEEAEMENMKLGQVARDLKQELHETQRELTATAETKKKIEDERKNLEDKLQYLSNRLKEVEQQKVTCEQVLYNREADEAKLKEENDKLSKATDELRTYLQQVENQSDSLVKEKEAIEQQLDRNFHHTALLEDERRCYSQRIKKLLVSLEDVSQEKKMTEKELRGEMVARLKAEHVLKAAVQAMERIEGRAKLKERMADVETMRDLRQDIAKLRAFVEEHVGIRKVSQKWSYGNLDFDRHSIINKFRQRDAINSINEEE